MDMKSDILSENPLLMAEVIESPACDGGIRQGPLDQEEIPAEEETHVLGLVELLLKNPRKADLAGLLAGTVMDVVPRFLGIALVSYAVFGLTLVLLMNFAPAGAYPRNLLPMPGASWVDGSALGLVLGYTLGLVAASGICLPTFYFFGLLAGVRLSILQITGLILRAKAASAMVLMGILPIYLAVVLGLLIFRAPEHYLEGCFYLGLVLPFLAGLEGVRCIYRGIHRAAEFQPEAWRVQRTCFLRRLTLSWAACYTVVSPVMVYRLWEMIGRGP
jgi:hypothetical protein